MSDELLDANARNAADYSEDTIRHLDDMTHIRMRPGMYIGRLGDGSHAEDGIYVLLKESIDNSIDEFNEGFGKKSRSKSPTNSRLRSATTGEAFPWAA